MTVGGKGVVGASVLLSLHHVDNDGHHQTVAQDVALLDDGDAGNVTVIYVTKTVFITHTKYSRS